MKSIALFIILAIALCLADLGVFFFILARDLGALGLVAWVTLHVCIGCLLMRAAGRAPVMPDDYDFPAVRHDAQGDPAIPSQSGHETATVGFFVQRARRSA